MATAKKVSKIDQLLSLVTNLTESQKSLEKKIEVLEAKTPHLIEQDVPEQDPAEVAVIAGRDPVAISHFARDKGAKEGWKAAEIEAYCHGLMRVAMNRAEHDPSGDRAQVARSKPKEQKKSTFTIKGEKHTCDVTLY